MSLPTLVFVAPAALCVLSWIGLGALVPRRLVPDEPLLAALTRIGAATAVLALAFFALGKASLFERWLFVAITVAAAVPGAVAARRMLRDVRLPSGRAVRLLLGATALALVVDIAAASAPPTSADALKYHLALPKRWFDLGFMDDPLSRWEGFSPFGIDMLYAQALAFVPGGEAAGVVCAVFGVLCALVVYELATSLGAGNAVAAAAASALFVLQGVVTWEATSSFIELGLTFYALLALRYALLLFDHVEARYALWVGVFAGAAAATKYVGLLPAALVLVACGVRVLHARRATLLAWLALPLLLLAGPWYLRNTIVTGNPVFPLVFGGRGWTAADNTEVEFLDRYGPGGSVLRVLVLPVDLVLNGEEFDRGRYVGILVFVFALVALALRPPRRVQVLWLAVLLYLALWWEMSAQARFLLPPLAVLSAIGGVAFARLLSGGRASSVAAWLGVGVAAATWALATGALTRQLLPPVAGAESRAAATQRLTGSSDALRAVAARVDGPIMLAGYTFSFLYPGRASLMGPPDFSADEPRSTLLARLRKYDASWILTPVPQLDDLPQLDTLRACLRRVDTFPARFVTSRSLGKSTPITFTLYHVEGCD